MILPRYPVYVPSKGRHMTPYTARCLVRDAVPFRIVVEPSEEAAYRAEFGDHVLVLPRDDMKLIGSRNWIKEHATAAGHARHWQLDDNIKLFKRLHERVRVPCRAGVALRVCEDFSDRYENVAVSGLNYTGFVIPRGHGRVMPPFYLNAHVYSCTLVNNAIKHRWRLVYNDDTDLCLQVLADGWCTVLLNAFMAEKIVTMQVKGGNTDSLYQGDGRLKMARMLERAWPGVVTTRRRFKRPQHVVAKQWRCFDNKLVLKQGADTSPINYGMRVARVRDEVKSPAMQAIYKRGKDGIE